LGPSRLVCACEGKPFPQQAVLAKYQLETIRLAPVVVLVLLVEALVDRLSGEPRTPVTLHLDSRLIEFLKAEMALVLLRLLLGESGRNQQRLQQEQTHLVGTMPPPPPMVALED